MEQFLPTTVTVRLILWLVCSSGSVECSCTAAKRLNDRVDFCVTVRNLGS